MVCTQLPYPYMCNMSCTGHDKNLVCVPTATVPLLAVRKRVCDYVYLLLHLQCCVASPAYVQFLEIRIILVHCFEVERICLDAAETLHIDITP